jgi:hypothetical protein
MAVVGRIDRDRGIHEEASIGTAMPMDSHQSTVRILPIRAAVIPEVRKLDRPVFMEQALRSPSFTILLNVLLRKDYFLSRHAVFIRTMCRGCPPLNRCERGTLRPPD